MHAQPSPYILASSSRTRSGIWTLTISVHISPVPTAVTPIFIYCAQLNNNNFAFFLLFSLLRYFEQLAILFYKEENVLKNEHLLKLVGADDLKETLMQ